MKRTAIANIGALPPGGSSGCAPEASHHLESP